MARRITTTDEIERMRERIYNFHRSRIRDRRSFDMAFSKEFQVSESSLTDKQKKFREAVFNNFRRNHPERVASQGELKEFKKAGGKDIASDRRTTRNVVRTRREYRRRGAQEADLKGVDTKPPVESFRQVARSKGRIVYARKTSVSVRGEKVTRYRDRRGRFASVKKRKR